MNTATAADLRSAVQYAPPAGLTAPDLIGVWTDGGFFLCAKCVGRVVARGMGHVLGKNQEQVWRGDVAPFGVCVTCCEEHGG